MAEERRLEYVIERGEVPEWIVEEAYQEDISRLVERVGGFEKAIFLYNALYGNEETGSLPLSKPEEVRGLYYAYIDYLVKCGKGKADAIKLAKDNFHYGCGRANHDKQKLWKEALPEVFN